MRLKCPKCGYPQYCGCDTCKKDGKEYKRWVWDKTGELISCGDCGYTMHCDRWLDLEEKMRDVNQ